MDKRRTYSKPEGGQAISMEYDLQGNRTKLIDPNAGTITSKYDVLGRVSKEIHPDGYSITNLYDKYGYLAQIKDPSGNLIWQAKESNARGQLTKTQSGGKETVFGFDSKGFPTSIVTSGITNLAYSFNTKGNLSSRQDNIAGYKEVFSYDAMNRLYNWDIRNSANTSLGAQSIVYNSTTGNITSKSDLGNYTLNYGENGKPHALTSIAGTPSAIPSAAQAITYTDFKKVKRITENGNQLDILYGTDEQRVKTVLTQSGGKLTRYYMGNYEEEIIGNNIRKIHYLCGGNGFAAVHIQNAGKDTLYYAHTDYQGSLIALSLTDGTVVERYAYDPWGKRRNPNDWSKDDSRTSFILNRGYTMHEHLPEFNLINMNGRVYDPLTAMFFSPDPYLQAPGNWLNYNRYGYCLNNPFLYTDPSGEFWWIIVGAIIGAYIGGSTAEGNLNPFEWNWDKNTWAGIGIGAAVGALGGWGFSVAAPALAGTPFFSHFGASGTIAAYSLTGTLAGGAVGYGAGFGTALYMSDGDWDYANKMGQRMSGLGSQIGSVAGIFAGGWEVYENYLQNRRPDADRRLTLAEANDWYRHGNGEPLDVDLENFDLSRISSQDFNETNPQMSFNLLFPNNISSINDGLVYGSISLTLHEGGYVTASPGFDTYNFEMHPWRTSSIRNIETIFGHIYAGWWGTPYQINIHGRKYLNNKKSR